jgi:hypothetical protein
MVIATVDKFARLAYEPRAAALFGNVNAFDTCWGFHRKSAPPDVGGLKRGETIEVKEFHPPDLIIQDELHLIQGPLGSMVGLYETAVDLLSRTVKDGKVMRPKYIASTATIRHTSSQVRCVFDRELFQFPPPAIDFEDSFYSINPEIGPFDKEFPNRLYVGVCAPGRGAQTPIVRIWSALLQTFEEIKREFGSASPESDQFRTIVGYFNAIRELAGTLGLYRDDVRDRLNVMSVQSGEPARSIQPPIELSSRTASSDLPGFLTRLAKSPGNDVDAVFATSMFGTGVDIDRLGLMVVHGQPKTTADYVQSTGRIGRKMGGLVVTFLRASRPRDLDHYEFFLGYHRSIHRYVEPITVYPFSPGTVERAIGPLAVVILRNARILGGTIVDREWAVEDRYSKKPAGVGPSGSRLIVSKRKSGDVKETVNAILQRGMSQPEGRKPQGQELAQDIQGELDRWEIVGKSEPALFYYEPGLVRAPQYPVVLGDPQHEKKNLKQVFPNAPQSLREVEATSTFEG